MAFSDWVFASTGSSPHDQYLGPFVHATSASPLTGHGAHGAELADLSERVAAAYTPAGSFTTTSGTTRIINALVRATETSTSQPDQMPALCYIGVKNPSAGSSFAAFMNGAFLGLTLGPRYSRTILLKCWYAGATNTHPTSGASLLASVATTSLTHAFDWNEWARLQLKLNYVSATSLRIRAYAGLPETHPDNLQEICDENLTSASGVFSTTMTRTVAVWNSNADQGKGCAIDAFGFEDIVE
jgi:hypothetical protein